MALDHPQARAIAGGDFPRGSREYLVCYPFEGRLAHQTLGLLLTRRLERLRMRPLGFCANEYALAVWALRDMGGLNMDKLFDEDMLGDDLDAWLAESNLYKRTFRNCAIIAGLIERRFPGREKTGRQVTFSSDLIYDVLREHEPDHILLRATYEDAATGLLDIARLSEMLARVKHRIVTKRLDRVSPLAVPALARNLEGNGGRRSARGYPARGGRVADRRRDADGLTPLSSRMDALASSPGPTAPLSRWVPACALLTQCLPG